MLPCHLPHLPGDAEGGLGDARDEREGLQDFEDCIHRHCLRLRRRRPHTDTAGASVIVSGPTDTGLGQLTPYLHKNVPVCHLAGGHVSHVYRSQPASSGLPEPSAEQSNRPPDAVATPACAGAPTPPQTHPSPHSRRLRVRQNRPRGDRREALGCRRDTSKGWCRTSHLNVKLYSLYCILIFGVEWLPIGPDHAPSSN